MPSKGLKARKTRRPHAPSARREGTDLCDALNGPEGLAKHGALGARYRPGTAPLAYRVGVGCCVSSARAWVRWPSERINGPRFPGRSSVHSLLVEVALLARR